MKTKRSEPEIVLRNGKPAAVIVDLVDYQELLERAEDATDLKRLKALRSRPMGFKKLSDVLKRSR